MKKLKLILCMAFMFVIGCACLVACNTKEENPPNQTTTITLAEAKTIIVNALAINEPSQLMLATANEQNEGNRDLLEKLGKFTFSNVAQAVKADDPSFIYQSGTGSSTGTMEYKSGSTTKFIMSMDNVENYYYDNDTTYVYGDDNQCHILGSNTMARSLSDSLKNIFSETAFDYAFKNNVNKVTTNNSYTLELTMDYSDYFRIIVDKYFDEEYKVQYDEFQNSIPKNLRDWQNVSLLITLDSNDQISSVELSLKNISAQGHPSGNIDYIKVTTDIEITKFTGTITQPQWVTDYLASQQ